MSRRVAPFYPAAMPDTQDRADRLAAQLRANLKRRKEQARAGEEPPLAPRRPDPPLPERPTAERPLD